MDGWGFCLGFIVMALAISILFRHPLKPSVLRNLVTVIVTVIQLSIVENFSISEQCW